MKKANIQPTPAELEILQILWEQGPSTVRFVNEKLSVSKDVGYTTTLKIMQIMNDKGLLKRDTSGKTHIYQVAAPQEKMQKQLVDRLLKTAFGGSAMKLVLQALGNNKSSNEELKQIKDFIDQLEGGKND